MTTIEPPPEGPGIPEVPGPLEPPPPIPDPPTDPPPPPPDPPPGPEVPMQLVVCSMCRTIAYQGHVLPDLPDILLWAYADAACPLGGEGCPHTTAARLRKHIWFAHDTLAARVAELETRLTAMEGGG